MLEPGRYFQSAHSHTCSGDSAFSQLYTGNEVNSEALVLASSVRCQKIMNIWEATRCLLVCAFLQSSNGPVHAFINFFILTCGTEMSFKVGRVVHVESVRSQSTGFYIYICGLIKSLLFVSICLTFFTFLSLNYFFLYFQNYLIEEDIFEENLFVEKEQDTCN